MDADTQEVNIFLSSIYIFLKPGSVSFENRGQLYNYLQLTLNYQLPENIPVHYTIHCSGYTFSNY
jgi:hypothetical protein